MTDQLPNHPQFERHRVRLLEILAEKSFQEREVTLSSGRKSNFYIDCKQTSLTAEGHYLIGQLFYQLIRSIAPEAEAVGGLTLGADPLASAVATMSFLAGHSLEAFIVRKEPKEHGTAQWLEGATNLRAGTPVVILEDVVTTGASTLRAIERARSAELDVRRVVTLVDRDEGGREAVETESPLTALFTRHDFFAR